MRLRSQATLRTFIWCFIFNGILVASFFFAAQQVVNGIEQWVDALVPNGAANIPADVQLALANLRQFLAPVHTYLAPAVFGAGALITLLLALVLQGSARRLIARAEQASAPAARESRAAAVEQAQTEQPAAVEDERPRHPPHIAAVQILSILQRQGRLIDFLQEDLAAFDDAQIGAAVRSIQQECQNALGEHLKLEPVFSQEEGTEVSVPADFDAASIRLTGNVVGDPPFRGVLRHRGWRVTRIDLPEITAGADQEPIIAPAEIEVTG